MNVEKNIMALTPMRGIVAEFQRWSEKEREGLAKILKAPANDPQSLAHHFRWTASGLVEFNLTDGPTYKEVVTRTAKKLKIRGTERRSIGKLEIEIAKNVFEATWDKLTTSERKRFERELLKAAGDISGDDIKKAVSGAGLFGAIGVAQMSGFGVYVLASTSLSTITGAVGLTLPFMAYTAASRAIAVVIGPVGWIGAGIFTLLQVSGPAWKKIIPAVIYICMIRNRPIEKDLRDNRDRRRNKSA